jgi:putative membrane protein
VTTAVEANRSTSETQVTAAVRTQVEAQVTEAVRTQVEQKVIYAATGMSAEDYAAAVSAGLVNAESQAAVKAATDEQMKTDAVKKNISDNVDAQIEKLISENMASDTVQSQLTAASEGAKSVISLKASLDSYNAFYKGLQTYTAGVSSAADGAAQLYAGSKTLAEGTGDLKDGASDLYDGVGELKDGVDTLVDGVQQLKDGALQLADGLTQFNEEGVQKLIDAVDGDVEGLILRFKATVDVSKNYRNFSGISDDMDGQVTFIYRTDEIEAAEAEE